MAGSLLVAADDVGERAAGFGEEVLRLRTLVGLTQQALADLTGVTRPYIAMIENGNRPGIGAHLVYSLSDALGVPVEHWRVYLGQEPTELPAAPPAKGKHK